MVHQTLLRAVTIKDHLPRIHRQRAGHSRGGRPAKNLAMVQIDQDGQLDVDRQRFRHYPEHVYADKIYGYRDNRRFLQEA